VPVSDIARRQDLGTAFLEQLLRPLKKAGLVAPWRGMKGGYTLAKPAFLSGRSSCSRKAVPRSWRRAMSETGTGAW
jgi:hypothetical protein